MNTGVTITAIICLTIIALYVLSIKSGNNKQ